MNIQSQVVSMEKLFQLAGINYKDILENTEIDIEEKNFKIKSFNHKSGQAEFKKINRLVRKQDSEMFKISSGDFSFMATPEHKVYTKEYGYIELKDIKDSCHILLDTNNFSELELEKLEGIYPVLDMTVEDNENYFSNNILSHNSPEKIGVGESMKFFASIRIKVTKSDQVKDDILGQEAIDINASVFKNKVAPPYKKAKFTLLTGKLDSEGNEQYGIDTYKEIIDFAVDYEIIGKGGAWYKYTINGTEERWQGSPNLIKYFKDNEKDFQELKSKVIEKMMEEKNKNKPVEGSFADVKDTTKKERKPREVKEVVIEETKEGVENGA